MTRSTVETDDDEEQLLIGYEDHGIHLAALIPNDTDTDRLQSAVGRFEEIAAYELTFCNLTTHAEEDVDTSDSKYGHLIVRSDTAVRDRAVSPVVGVMLMVAVTVILAAVVATAVLGLGGDFATQAPNANFDFTQNGSHVDVRHTNGDTLDNSSITILLNGSVMATDPSFPSAIQAGSRATVRNVPSGGLLEVRWVGHDRSSILVSWRKP